MFLSLGKGLWFGFWGIIVLTILLACFGGFVTEAVRHTWEYKRSQRRALLLGYRTKSGKRQLSEWLIGKFLDGLGI